MTNKQGEVTQWVGLANWVRVLTKDSFWDVIWITLKMAGINLVFTFAIALLFALLATKKVRFSKWYHILTGCCNFFVYFPAKKWITQ